MSIRDKFEVAPLPRNVHPVHKEGRQKTMDATIIKQVQKHEITENLVDAAEYGDGNTFAVVAVDSSGKTSNSASIRTVDPAVAEEAAIALALLDGHRPVSTSGFSTRSSSRHVSRRHLPVLWADLYCGTHALGAWLDITKVQQGGVGSLLWSPCLDKQVLAVRHARDRADGLDLPVSKSDNPGARQVCIIAESQ
ncbi:hypothetical protein HPB50_006802 [Hyalomma asiaticum]|uniref:Uncharacterized protein n=1 Tax=Hyalomma asiaticum TaxID=266040 RepID=A0ACB7SL17_HYAAI|nr:hypothetical protein HPB50_006802 [Hyalomma asiaticum]